MRLARAAAKRPRPLGRRGKLCECCATGARLWRSATHRVSKFLSADASWRLSQSRVASVRQSVLFTSLNDAPEPWQSRSQDPATPVQGTTDLCHDVCFINCSSSYLGALCASRTVLPAELLRVVPRLGVQYVAMVLPDGGRMQCRLNTHMRGQGRLSGNWLEVQDALGLIRPEQAPHPPPPLPSHPLHLIMVVERNLP